MSAPTFNTIQSSSYTGTGNPATASITWSAGDLIIVVGVTEDNDSESLATPTATGLTFSAVPGTPTSTTSNTKCYAWSATAGSGGSGAVTSAHSGTGRVGITAYPISGSDGIGTVTLMASTTSTNPTVSLTRAGNNSGVIIAFGDWNAVNDVIVGPDPSAAGTTDVISRTASAYRAYVAHWTDQGAAGSTNYGLMGDSGAPKWIGLALEIKGTGGGGGRTALNTRSNPLGVEIGMGWRMPL